LGDSKQVLLEYIQAHAAALHGTVRLYVLRAGLASGDHVPAAALEVVQDTIVEALAHVDRYRPDREPMAWLLGIAINVIKRHQRTTGRRARREISFGQLSTHAPEPLVEADLLDHLLPSFETGPEQTVEADEEARALLALVTVEDQQILRLAVLEGFDSASLAARLKTSPGASRTRLHRALSRLRAAWRALQEEQQGESKDE
jgi:RNA polymerase sigma-70 factor (ECF subfamily)